MLAYITYIYSKVQVSVQAFLITDALYHADKILREYKYQTSLCGNHRYWSQFQDISFNCGNNLPDIQV